jgi:hypothetical protein
VRRTQQRSSDMTLRGPVPPRLAGGGDLGRLGAARTAVPRVQMCGGVCPARCPHLCGSVLGDVCMYCNGPQRLCAFGLVGTGRASPLSRLSLAFIPKYTSARSPWPHFSRAPFGARRARRRRSADLRRLQTW